MDIYDQILENLELERELGTRTVEIDRALLVPPKPEPRSAPTPKAKLEREPSSAQGPRPTPSPAEKASGLPPTVRNDPPSAACDILFLSGRPLSEAGEEAMGKTVAAMRRIKPDVSVRMNEDSRAKVIVLLGSDALRGRTPVPKRVVRGRWMTVDGVPALPTFSPDYIFSYFQEGSPGMVAAKRDMWNDIKAALARL